MSCAGGDWYSRLQWPGQHGGIFLNGDDHLLMYHWVQQAVQASTKDYHQHTFPLDLKSNFLMSQTQIEEDQDPVACQDEDDGDQ